MLHFTLLLLATLIWGLGFVGTRWTFELYTPIWSHGLRFVFAGLIALPFLFKNWRKHNYKAAVICSILLYTGLYFQTVGISITTLAKSGFLTTLYAVFTPLLCLLFFKQKFRVGYWFLLLGAMFGVALMCELKLDSFNRGDAFVALSALFFATHIIAIDKLAVKENPIRFNFLCCTMVGIIGLFCALLFEGPVQVSPLLNDLSLDSPLAGFVLLSIFSSLFAFSIQVFVQKKIKPHIVSLTFLMEGVFSAYFGYLFFQELLSYKAIAGAALLLLCVALVPLVLRPKKNAKLTKNEKSS